MLVLQANNAELLVEFQLGIAAPTVVSGAVPMEELSLLTLFLAVVRIIVVHYEVFSGVPRLRQKYH